MIEWPSPSRAGEWIDAAGTRWRLRGEGLIALKRAEQLLRSPEVDVLLFYGAGAPARIPPADRPALWERVRPHLRESTPSRPGDHTRFDVAEFKDDQRRSLLVIEESC